MLFLSSAFAAVPPSNELATLKKSLREQILARRDVRFGELLKKWESQYGTRAAVPLVELAKDASLNDSARYIAIMGAARTGGRPIAPTLLPLLKDSSWMVRSAVLTALKIFKEKTHSTQMLEMLKDPALFVRLEAVDTLRDVHRGDASPPPTLVVNGLVDSVFDQRNYRGGKSQWVPTRALEALITLRAPSSVLSRLRPLLEKSQDTLLLAQTVLVFETLSGKTLQSGKSLQAKADSWKKAKL